MEKGYWAERQGRVDGLD